MVGLSSAACRSASLSCNPACSFKRAVESQLGLRPGACPLAGESALRLALIFQQRRPIRHIDVGLQRTFFTEMSEAFQLTTINSPQSLTSRSLSSGISPDWCSSGRRSASIRCGRATPLPVWRDVPSVVVREPRHSSPIGVHRVNLRVAVAVTSDSRRWRRTHCNSHEFKDRPPRLPSRFRRDPDWDRSRDRF